MFIIITIVRIGCYVGLVTFSMLNREDIKSLRIEEWVILEIIYLPLLNLYVHLRLG